MGLNLFSNNKKIAKKRVSQLAAQKERRYRYLEKCANGDFASFIIPDLAQFFRDLYYIKNGIATPTPSISLTNLVFSELLQNSGGDPRVAMKMIASSFAIDKGPDTVSWYRSQYNISRLVKNMDAYREESKNIINVWHSYVKGQWEEMNNK